MNTGAVSSRYAKALLKYVQETGRGEQVCAQVRTLLSSPDSAGTLEPELQKFTELLVKNGRMEDVRLIFTTFVRMYYESTGTLLAHLTTTIPAPEVALKLHDLLEKQTGGRVIMDTEVDPSLIGGFVLEVGDYMLDGSVRHQIEAIRRQFVTQNNRLV